jgi:hypothetical protein
MNPFRRSQRTRWPSESSLRTWRRARALRPSWPEELEDRAVPTVAFLPKVPQTVVDGHGVKLPDPPVYLIFWGSGWLTSTNPLMSDITAAARRLLSGPYLSRLAQYSNPGGKTLGVAHLSKSILDSSSDPSPAGVTNGDIEQEISNAINKKLLPDTFHTDNGNQALYIVVTLPTIKSVDHPEAGGYHSGFCNAGPCVNYA